MGGAGGGAATASCLSYNICIQIIYTYILASRCCAQETTELRPAGGGFFQVDDDSDGLVLSLVGLSSSFFRLLGLLLEERRRNLREKFLISQFSVGLGLNQC